MDISELIKQRIEECETERHNYIAWLSKLRLPNLLLIGGGSTLAFLGGAAILANVAGVKIAGTMSLIGGVLTGLHSWLQCEPHQAECRQLAGQFESLKSRYEMLRVDQDNETTINRYKELEAELAKIKESRKTMPWKGFLDFGNKA